MGKYASCVLKIDQVCCETIGDEHLDVDNMLAPVQDDRSEAAQDHGVLTHTRPYKFARGTGAFRILAIQLGQLPQDLYRNAYVVPADTDLFTTGKAAWQPTAQPTSPANRRCPPPLGLGASQPLPSLDHPVRPPCFTEHPAIHCGHSLRHAAPYETLLDQRTSSFPDHAEFVVAH